MEDVKMRAYVIRWDNFSSFPEDEEHRIISVHTEESGAIKQCEMLNAKEQAQMRADEDDESRPPYPSSYYGKYTYVELPLNPSVE